MNRTLKIFLTCACGAGIGTLVSLQLKQWYNLNFWALVIGMVIGGLIGYIFIEAKQFILAIPKAWRMAGQTCKGAANGPLRLYRRLANREFGKTLLLSATAGASLASSFSLIAICMTFVGTLGTQRVLMNSNEVLYSIVIMTTIGLALFAFLAVAVVIESLDRAEIHYKSVHEGLRQLSKIIIFKINPIAVYIYWPLRGLWELGKLIYRNWQIIKTFIKTFFKNLFILTHSDWRVLCGIDSMIGVVVGFAFGNAIIGFIAGGLFGLANYEIVSVRIFKLVPERIKK